MTPSRRVFLCLCLALALNVCASAQWIERPRTGSSQAYLPDRTKLAGMSGMGPQLEAKLVDQDRNASQKRATVRAEVWGVELVDPTSGGEPSLDSVYLMYRLDDGDIIRTAEEEHTFANLSPGYHNISVQLSSLSGQPVGTRLNLRVNIPK